MQLGLVGQRLVGTAYRSYVVKQAVFRQRWPSMDGGKVARSAPAQQKKRGRKKERAKSSRFKHKILKECREETLYKEKKYNIRRITHKNHVLNLNLTVLQHLKVTQCAQNQVYR